jgi:carbonic anhydrase
VQANVLLQLAHVRTFPMVAQRVAAGELTLHGWAYDFEHGEMYVHDRQNAFVPLSSVDDSAPDAYAQLAGTVESVSTGEA